MRRENVENKQTMHFLHLIGENFWKGQVTSIKV